MSAFLNVWFIEYDFLLTSSRSGRKQPAKFQFRNIWHHSWQPWAGFTGQRKSLLPHRSYSNAIPHTLTSVQPARGPSEGKEGWVREEREGALWKTHLTARRNLWRIVSSHCSFGRPNVLAIKFETHSPAQSEVKKHNHLFLIVKESSERLPALQPPPSILLSFLPSAAFPTVELWTQSVLNKFTAAGNKPIWRH